jgi:protein TonB
MLGNLLESKKQGKKSFKGTFFSVLLHTALLVFAIVATARASGRTFESPKAEKLNYVEVKKHDPPPPEQKKPDPPKPKPAPPKVKEASLPVLPKEVPIAPPKGFKVLEAPVTVPVSIPTVDLNVKVTDPADFAGRGVPGGTAKGVDGGTGSSNSTGTATGVSEDHIFHEDEVETPAAKIGGDGPRYPESLRASAIEGEVIVQFVVNEDGRYDSGSLKVLNSSNPAFTAAVKQALPGMRFSAARVGGRKVRQLVQLPFEFHLNR